MSDDVSSAATSISASGPASGAASGAGSSAGGAGSAGGAAGAIGQAVSMAVQADADAYVRQKQSEVAMMTVSANQAAQIAKAYGFDQARS
jgi:hypothetical protein